MILTARPLRARTLLAGVFAVLAALPLTVVGSTPARADSSADAEKQAKQIVAKVTALQKQVDAALAAYDSALGGLAGAVNSNIAADIALNTATQQSYDATAQAAARVRALYRSGGPMALFSSVLDGSTPSEVVTRIQVVRRVVADDYKALASGRQVLGTATANATSARANANNRAHAAGEVDAIARRLEK